MGESNASLDELLEDMIGKPTGRSKVVVERGTGEPLRCRRGEHQPDLP